MPSRFAVWVPYLCADEVNKLCTNTHDRPRIRSQSRCTIIIIIINIIKSWRSWSVWKFKTELPQCLVETACQRGGFVITRQSINGRNVAFFSHNFLFFISIFSLFRYHSSCSIANKSCVIKTQPHWSLEANRSASHRFSDDCNVRSVSLTCSAGYSAQIDLLSFHQIARETQRAGIACVISAFAWTFVTFFSLSLLSI